MRKDNPVRRVDVKRLSLAVRAAARRRISDVSDAHPSLEPTDASRVKDIADHAICLDLVEATARAAGDDARGILATVLEQTETFAAGSESERESGHKV